MQKYRVQVVPEAEEKVKEYLSYLLFVKRSKQAYKAVKADYFLLYEIIDGEKPIARVISMFHESEDYIKQLTR